MLDAINKHSKRFNEFCYVPYLNALSLRAPLLSTLEVSSVIINISSINKSIDVRLLVAYRLTVHLTRISKLQQQQRHHHDLSLPS